MSKKGIKIGDLAANSSYFAPKNEAPAVHMALGPSCFSHASPTGGPRPSMPTRLAVLAGGEEEAVDYSGDDDMEWQPLPSKKASPTPPSDQGSWKTLPSRVSTSPCRARKPAQPHLPSRGVGSAGCRAGGGKSQTNPRLSKDLLVRLALSKFIPQVRRDSMAAAVMSAPVGMACD